MSATRKRLRGKSEKPVESESARSLRNLEAFLSRTPRIIRSLLCHTSIEESCIGAPVFFQAPSSLVRKCLIYRLSRSGSSLSRPERSGDSGLGTTCRVERSDFSC